MKYFINVIKIRIIQSIIQRKKFIFSAIIYENFKITQHSLLDVENYWKMISLFYKRVDQQSQHTFDLTVIFYSREINQEHHCTINIKIESITHKIQQIEQYNLLRVVKQSILHIYVLNCTDGVSIITANIITPNLTP